jgi:hypothetical protein
MDEQSHNYAGLASRICSTTRFLNWNLQVTQNAIAFVNDFIILTKGESMVEAENYMNLELRKISDWIQNNKLKFNEHK